MHYPLNKQTNKPKRGTSPKAKAAPERSPTEQGRKSQCPDDRDASPLETGRRSAEERVAKGMAIPTLIRDNINQRLPDGQKGACGLEQSTSAPKGQAGYNRIKDGNMQI